ncbi:MAG: tetratricopeptide repeat protein [Phormidesmis sp.]
MIKQYLDEALSNCETLLPAQTETDSSPASTSAQKEQPSPQTPYEQKWMEACQTVANILTSMGFIQEAYPWRSMAFDLVPNSAKFYAESGRVCSQCEAWEQAIYFCQRTLEYDPSNAAVHRQLAQVYHRIGDRTAETQTINNLLAQRPEVAEAEGHFQLGQVLRGQKQLPEAIACYQRAIEQDSQYTHAYYAIGDLWAQQGSQAQTVELFQQMVEQLPETAQAHYRLGKAYRQTQQADRAIAAFRSAIRLDPHLHWAYMGLLNILMQRSLWDEAIATCQSVIKAASPSEMTDIAWAYCFMGNAQAKKGDKALAARAHQKAFELRGWPQPAERDYQFGLNWFSENILVWTPYLAPLNELSMLRHPLQMLSLGAQDDSSLLWLVDTVLIEPEDRLTCITDHMSDRLQQNRAKLPQPNQLMLQTGDTQAQLAALPEETFDWVYVQSDRKQADYLRSAAAHIWRSLKVSGLLCFKDYHWRHPSDPNQSSKVGIDAFIASVGDSAEVLCHSHQIILRKCR